jgi:hypothetical protein
MLASRLGEFSFGYFQLKKEATQGRVVSLQGHNESKWVWCVCRLRRSVAEQGRAQRPTLQSGDPTRVLAHTLALDSRPGQYVLYVQPPCTFTVRSD